MSAQDKTIRIAYSVDENSISKARRAIQELTSDVKRLVESTSGLGNLFGGGARVSATPGQSHTSAGTQLGNRPGGAGGGGLADNLTKTISGNAYVFKAAATETKAAVRLMTEALAELGKVGGKELDGVVARLGSMHSLSSRMAQSGASSARMNALGNNAAASLRDQLYGMPPAPSQGGGASGSGGSGGSLRSRIAGIFGNGGSGGGNGFGNMLGGLAGNAGLGFLAGGGALAIAGGTAAYMARAYRGYELGGYNQTMQMPMWSGNIGAQLGGIFGGQAEALRGGDVARTMAMRRVTKSAEYEQLMSAKYTAALAASIEKSHPTGFFDSIAAGQLQTNVGEKVGRGTARAGGLMGRLSDFMLGPKMDGSLSANSMAPDEHLTNQEFGKAQAMAEAKTEQAQKFKQMTENEMQARIKLSNMGNEIWSGASGMAGLADASRTSGGFRYDKNKGTASERMRGGVAIDNTTMNFQQRAMQHGWDPGAVAGTMGALVGPLGWRESGRSAEQVMSLSAGGLGSAASILGAGGQYGGSLLKAFQKRIGGGGLDIGAGSGLGGMVSSMMMGGNFGSGGGGAGLADILLGASAGGGGYGDMLGARQVQSGVGATDRMMSGGIDPLQKALNASAALKVAGNSPYATQNALMNMSSGTALDIVRKGKVGGVLGKSGITPELVQAYLGQQDKTAFSRIDRSMLTGSQSAAVDKYRANGLTKGADLESLAGALSLGTGDDIDSALGRLKIQSERLFPTKAIGRGAGRSFSMKSQAGEALFQQGAIKGKRGADYAAARDELDEGIKNSKGDAEELDKAGAIAGANAGSSTSAAIDNVTSALLIFVQTLKRETSGGGRSGTAAVPR